MTTNGVKTKAKLTEKQRLRKEVTDLRKQMEILRKQFQQFNMKLIQDLRLFENRTMASWEYLWATIEALRVEGNLEFLSEETVENFREILLTRWKAEALETIKNELQAGEGVCIECHFKDGGPNFYKDDEQLCPNCNEKDTMFLKDTEIVEEKKEATG